jgi:hypothetical protein
MFRQNISMFPVQSVRDVTGPYRKSDPLPLQKNLYFFGAEFIATN